MRLLRFLLFDGLGALIWVGAFAGLGYLFSNQLEGTFQVFSHKKPLMERGWSDST